MANSRCGLVLVVFNYEATPDLSAGAAKHVSLFYTGCIPSFPASSKIIQGIYSVHKTRLWLK